jgi:flavin reductase (DIM6/NTAB) family NADH-FMN oxidoreductase RutF
MTQPLDADTPELSRRMALAATAAAVLGAPLASVAQGAAAAPSGAQPRPAMPFPPQLPPPLEAAKKNAFILIPYGLFLLGVAEGDRRHAAIVNWVMQSAYRQPQFTMGVRRPGEFGLGAGPASDALHAALLRVRQFSLSFLGGDQADLARGLLQPPQGDFTRVAGATFHAARTGAPILSTAPAWFEARVESTMDSADHTLCLCTVTNAGNTTERALLMDRDATARPRGWLAAPPAA